jgi:hypothetical protein
MRTSSSRSPSRVAAVLCVLAVGALANACTSAAAHEHPAAPSGGVAAPDHPASPSSGSAPAPSAAADLVGSMDQRPATLAVTVGAEQRGVPPLQTVTGTLPDVCGSDATEYAHVSVRFGTPWQPTKETGDSANLRVDLTVVGGSGAGILVVDPQGAGDYCSDLAALSARATLQTENLSDEHQTMEVYVLARTGSGAADPLHGVTLQLRDLRHHPDDIDAGAWTWGVQRVTAGSACPGDPNSLCVPLG